MTPSASTLIPVAAQSQTQHEILGSSVAGSGRASTSSEVIDLTLDPNDQMDLDLFGEIDDDDDDDSDANAKASADAEGENDMQEVEKLFSTVGGGSDPDTGTGTGATQSQAHSSNEDTPFIPPSNSQLTQLSQQSTVDASGDPASHTSPATLLANLSNFTGPDGSGGIPPISSNSSNNDINMSSNSDGSMFGSLGSMSLGSMSLDSLNPSSSSQASQQQQSTQILDNSQQAQPLDLGAMDLDFSTDFFSNNAGGGGDAGIDSALGLNLEDMESQLQSMSAVDFFSHVG